MMRCVASLPGRRRFWLARCVAPAAAAGGGAAPPAQHWSFDGPFGSLDLAAAQRGFQVYSEVCAVCHSMQYLHYRDLDRHRPDRGPDQGDRRGGHGAAGTGRSGQSEGRAGDAGGSVQSPFPNEQAARAANNGALPPDLSLIVNAREGHADYVYAHPDRLRRSAAGHADAGGDELQQILPRPSDRHAAAAARWPGHLCRRHVGDASSRWRTTSSPSWPGPPTPRWCSASRSAGAWCCFLMLMTGLTYAVKRKVWADVH